MEEPREMMASDWISKFGSTQGNDVVERSDLIREGYGLEAIGLSREHLEALLAGKVLHTDVAGEYAVLIYLEATQP